MQCRNVLNIFKNDSFSFKKTTVKKKTNVFKKDRFHSLKVQNDWFDFNKKSFFSKNKTIIFRKKRNEKEEFYLLTTIDTHKRKNS